MSPFAEGLINGDEHRFQSRRAVREHVDSGARSRYVSLRHRRKTF